MNTVADTDSTDSATVALARFNRLPPAAAAERLRRCCANAEWATRMAAGRPYDSLAQLLDAADRHWRALPAEAWLQAFGAHPEIGDMKTAGNSAAAAAAGDGDGDSVGDSRQEQSGVANASAQTRAALAHLNRDYRQRFGFIFIICASGLSADAMLVQLRVRLKNSRAQELANAAEEQRKITRLRLRKLFDGDATVAAGAATVETVTVDSSAKPAAATEAAKPATANSTTPAMAKPAATTPTSPPPA
ncbi:MAG: 2-oxo-4-hydroxy-4-carboxy-5-ureidoimidazoline decarboxylase [Gammaproteobacteria bacterium]|nr:2-oxo-4-hydroxy-4-carboxy-5-ureidoimidazoline decarboxylase [Gammaproteobacteria bacterium]